MYNTLVILSVSILFIFLQVRLASGHGKITSPNSVAVLDTNGNVAEEIKTKNILIATGSEVTPFQGLEVNIFVTMNHGNANKFNRSIIYEYSNTLIVLVFIGIMYIMFLI